MRLKKWSGLEETTFPIMAGSRNIKFSGIPLDQTFVRGSFFKGLSNLTMLVCSKKDKSHTVPCIATSTLHDTLQICTNYVKVAKQNSEPITLGGHYDSIDKVFRLKYFKSGNFEVTI